MKTSKQKSALIEVRKKVRKKVRKRVRKGERKGERKEVRKEQRKGEREKESTTCVSTYLHINDTHHKAYIAHHTAHTAIAYLDVVVSTAAAGEAADELFDVDDVVVVAVHGGEKA